MPGPCSGINVYADVLDRWFRFMFRFELRDLFEKARRVD